MAEGKRARGDGIERADPRAARPALQAKGYANEHEALAKREKLTSVARCETSKAYTTKELETLRRKAEQRVADLAAAFE